MYKTALSLSLLALAAFGAPQLWQNRNYLSLEEEVMTIEHESTLGVATVKLKADIPQALDRIEVRDPYGMPVLNLRTGVQGVALTALLVEFEETDIASLMASYPAGMYDIRAQTVDGTPVAGRVPLFHQLPNAPVILHPLDGARGVPTAGFEVSWNDDPESIRWKVLLEQNDNDGLAVELAAGTTSFVIPEGVLRSGERTLLEVIAFDRSGNSTTSEIEFTTR